MSFLCCFIMSTAGFVILVVLVGGGAAFDLTLDNERHLLRWAINGSYVYGVHEEQVASLRPTSAPRLLRSGVGGEGAEGVWLTKYSPRGPNKWRLSYSLTHVLFKEAWIVWMASPSVPLVVKTSRDEEIGRFWSDGRGWCDVVVDVNYRSTLTLEVETPEPDDYAMIDKVTLGVMRNVTALQGKRQSLRQCHTAPTESPPDMEEKNEFIPRSRGGAGEEGGDVTEERRYEQQRPDGAVCDCQCSCRKRNATST